MSMKLDLIWQDDDAIEYRATCNDCSFRSESSDDEEIARAAWLLHACADLRTMSLP